MPAVNPQSSRGGLVAAVIVFTVLFVAAAIFAIYYGVQDSKAEDALQTLNSRFKEIAIDLTGPDVSQLRTLAKGDAKLSEPTALAEAMRQRDELRRMILGLQPTPSGTGTDVATQSDVDDTLNKARQAVTAANAVLGAAGGKMNADNLTGAVSDLTVAVQNLNKAAAAAVAERDRARAQAAKDSQASRDAQARAESAINTAKEQLQQQIDAANDAVKKSQDQLEAAKKAFEDEQRASSVALDSADKQHAETSSQVETLNKQIATLRDKLAGRRIGVEDPMVRRPQGEIVRIADTNTVYISLGLGDQIVPGMTFEVYDKTQPLPKLGDGLSELNLPAGKASVEVTRVLANGSECHVNHVALGQQIVQGDPILNLIYDRNVKFNFFVFGDFDIARTGKSTPAGGDIIKRLITQWGGAIDPKLDVETDFVVVGTPPDVPVFTAEELKDPINEQKLANFKRAADDYDRIVQRAQELHIPIMNQNKFLYFTGYYDLALR